MGVAIITPDVNFADANLGKVTLTDNVPVRSLSIIAPESITGTKYQLGVSYYPINTNQRGVSWSIESGSEYASISSSGLMSIKTGANKNNVTIKATSSHNSSVVSVKTINVTYKSDDIPFDTTLSAQAENSSLIFGKSITSGAFNDNLKRAVILTNENFVNNKRLLNNATTEMSNMSLFDIPDGINSVTLNYTTENYILEFRFTASDGSTVYESGWKTSDSVINIPKNAVAFGIVVGAAPSGQANISTSIKIEDIGLTLS